MRGRYSIIGLEPDLIWRAVRRPRRRPIASAAMRRPTFSRPCGAAPLAALRALHRGKPHRRCPRALPPMAAGVFGYLGYDMVRLMERAARRQAGPDRRSRRHADAADADGGVRRRAATTSRPSTPVRPQPASRARHAYARRGAAGGRRQRARSSAGRHAPRSASAEPAHGRADPPTRPRPSISTMVAKAKEYIAAGDIFQVVLSQRFRRPSSCRRSRSIARCGASTRRPSCSILDFGGFRGGRLEPGNPGAAARRRRSPSARSPARGRAARRRGRRQGAGRRAAGRSRRSGPSI